MKYASEITAYKLAGFYHSTDELGRPIAIVTLHRTSVKTGNALQALILKARLDVGVWLARHDGAEDDVPSELMAYIERRLGIDARGAA